MALKKHWLWLAWMAATASMAGLLTYKLLGPDRRNLLPGETSAGHYQIELACNACHTPWMGVKEDACYGCHAEELKAANDSHPKNKFIDPRNADRLKLVSADNCVACHREHVPHQTRAMGVTMPDDYCYHCHQQTLTDRPSHKNFKFDSCATAGCHNFHDNTALYESFLLKHADEPPTKDSASLPRRDLLAYLSEFQSWKPRDAIDLQQHDAPATAVSNSTVLHDWATTAHARAGVNCTGCHTVEDKTTKTKRWSDKLDHTACRSCHESEVQGFLTGKHGMRLAQNLSPMTPGLARLPMKPEAAHRELSCTSCHSAHAFDARTAAVDSCLACHNDEHSLAFKSSKHSQLWQNELNGDAAPGTGVSCATCHLPREVHQSGNDTRVLVQHNQNYNLRPNEKMLRSVCLNCHGLAFSIDALADAALVRSNFIGRPAGHVESIDLALRRQMELQKRK
ncbi:MAG TPA: NrfA- nitrite reduction protein [Verrucomicrobiae bacterium]|nr:NrfA- nitrite reduction protein [Verrucomicrobiae bacterium]